jgi:hypothetical protein
VAYVQRAAELHLHRQALRAGTLRAWLARGMVAPFIMVDELIYSELAKSFADTGRFFVRDQATAAYGIVYPALMREIKREWNTRVPR